MKPGLFKKIAGHIMDMHMQAMRPWQANQFVAYDVITADWQDADFDRARTAQQVVDGVLAGMARGG